MAVKGLDIFKLSPKTNCKDCGSPTCMAFCMKVAQGAVPITKCPHMSQEAIALLQYGISVINYKLPKASGSLAKEKMEEEKAKLEAKLAEWN